jgi:hypothetical protein
MTATASARGRSNRNRGARAERAVVNWLRANGYPDARRYLAGDGRQPGDIDFHPLITLEAKDPQDSCWPTWCRQAAAAAPPGTVPVVVRRTRGNPDVGQWECRVRYPEARMLGDWGECMLYSTPDPWWVGLPFADLIAAVRQLDEADR